MIVMKTVQFRVKLPAELDIEIAKNKTLAELRTELAQAGYLLANDPDEQFGLIAVRQYQDYKPAVALDNVCSDCGQKKIACVCRQSSSYPYPF